jgi:hypothetical protein
VSVLDRVILAASIGLQGVLRGQGDLGTRPRLGERALAIREARLGPGHPDTARNRQKLAAVVAALDD